MSNVSLTKEEYMKLVDSADKLARFDAAGVDNWEGYEIALDGYKPRSELYKEANRILEEITEGSQIDYPAGRDAGPQIIFSDSAIDIIVGLLEK